MPFIFQKLSQDEGHLLNTLCMFSISQCITYVIYINVKQFYCKSALFTTLQFHVY